jgi:tripartite-type tricarboxylate transporter receptor subunit TctC
LGVLVPAQTPQPIIALLHREIRNAMNEPDVAEKLASLGFETIASTPDEFSARIRADVPKFTKIIRAADIKAE